MKFRSIPQDIEAIQFFAKDQNVLPAYIKIKNEAGVCKVFNPLHDSWINVYEGDWIRIDIPNDIYPITADYLKSKYRPKEEVNG